MVYGRRTASASAAHGGLGETRGRVLMQTRVGGLAAHLSLRAVVALGGWASQTVAREDGQCASAVLSTVGAGLREAARTGPELIHHAHLTVDASSVGGVPASDLAWTGLAVGSGSVSVAHSCYGVVAAGMQDSTLAGTPYTQQQLTDLEAWLVSLTLSSSAGVSPAAPAGGYTDAAGLDVIATAALDTPWLQAFDARDESGGQKLMATWRFLHVGTAHGVFRFFPARYLSGAFDYFSRLSESDAIRTRASMRTDVLVLTCLAAEQSVVCAWH
eukprot:3135778-Rhodomonas_salina.2